MKNNKTIAWIVTAILIAYSIFIIGGNKLVKIRENANNTFYNGVAGEDKVMSTELEKIAGFSKNLLTIAERVMPEEKELLSKFSKALEDLKTQESLKKKYLATTEIRKLAKEIVDTAEKKEKTDQDKMYLESLNAEIKATILILNNIGYNAEAKKANEELSGFPQILIRQIRGVKLLELYE